MKDVPKIITRGNMTYVLYPEKVIVGIGLGQWVSYNQYDNWNRQGITQFRKMILKSREDQLTTPSDQITLASQCGIRGTSTRKPEVIKGAVK